MINKKFIQGLKKQYDAHEGERRQIISRANDVLHDSKRVIFSLHREDIKEAEASLAAISGVLKSLEKKFGRPRLEKEGAYKAAVEEYAEAEMFFKFMTVGRLDKISAVKLDSEGYLGGICDCTGEMVRLAVNRAAKGKIGDVETIKDSINDIMSELVKFNMTGYLRTKFDQAKSNLRKIEQINYEIKIRR